MSQAIVGGNNRYPSLQSIADLFRSQINDDAAGATGTPGEGNIAFNTAPFLLTIMNSAIRDLYSDLRNVGDPALILDNYILTGIPALTKADPAVQVSLSYAGYFNGFTWNPAFTLPIGLERLFAVWERVTGSNDNFNLMTQVPSGLQPCYQSSCMGQWEMRQNALWMPGALLATDLRLRGRITYPDFLNPATLNFTTAYVPILDCQNAIVAKMYLLYAKRFAPDMYQMAVAEEARLMGKLQLEIVRQQQSAETQRGEWGTAATSDFNWYYQL